MSTPTRHRIAAALLTAALIPGLSACGFDAQTEQVYQPGVGVNDRDGVIDVLAAVVISPEDGPATFVASLVNGDQKKDDQLVGAKAEGGEPVLVDVDVPADRLVNLAETGGIALTGAEVEPGNFLKVTLEFKNGQSTTVNAPVVSDDAPYDDVITASPTPSASPSKAAPGAGAQTPSGAPSPASTGGAAPTPSATPAG